jgi:hypothetical protein
MRAAISTFAFVVLAGLCFSVSIAQDVPAPSQPESEHKFLQQFVGEWKSVMKAQMGPGQEMECEGTMSSKMLGDIWVVNKTQGDMMGMTMHALQTIGYDPEKKKYVGTWVDSMHNHLWRYEGTVDQSGKKIMLEAEGPSFTSPGDMAMYRDSYEFVSPDRIIATSEVKNEDGEWQVFMTGEITRTEDGGESEEKR